MRNLIIYKSLSNCYLLILKLWIVKTATCYLLLIGSVFGCNINILYLIYSTGKKNVANLVGYYSAEIVICVMIYSIVICYSEPLFLLLSDLGACGLSDRGIR